MSSGAPPIRVAVMHGVNLGQLGRRDPAQYGTLTLPELERAIAGWGAELGVRTSFFQTDHEGAFVGHLHGARETADAIVLNPGAWTHYAWAIRDALEIAALPAIEVHLSDVDAREAWRRVSVLDGMVAGRVTGQGPEGYREALRLAREAAGA